MFTQTVWSDAVCILSTCVEFCFHFFCLNGCLVFSVCWILTRLFTIGIFVMMCVDHLFAFGGKRGWE